MNVIDIGNSFVLEKANNEEFGKYFAIYVIYEDNVWFRDSFDRSRKVLDDYEGCFWVKKNNNRVGGVLLEKNYMNCLFTIPPCDEFDLILDKIKNHLISESEKGESITVGSVKAKRLKNYEDAGFIIKEQRRCMIRTTEKIEYSFPEDFKLIEVNENRKEDLIKLFVDAFSDDYDNRSYEQSKLDIEFYLKHLSENESVVDSSRVIIHSKSEEIIGACLVSIWEGWPNIYDIAVKREYQGKGLGNNLLKRAITELEETYPVIRLFVTVGNPAEEMYNKLGFLPGNETSEMIIKASSIT